MVKKVSIQSGFHFITKNTFTGQLKHDFSDTLEGCFYRDLNSILTCVRQF